MSRKSDASSASAMSSKGVCGIRDSAIRITAQLIDTKSGTHLWAEKFDRDKSEIFEIQDEVVRAVAASTQTQLIARERGNKAGREQISTAGRSACKPGLKVTK